MLQSLEEVVGFVRILLWDTAPTDVLELLVSVFDHLMTNSSFPLQDVEDGRNIDFLRVELEED